MAEFKVGGKAICINPNHLPNQIGTLQPKLVKNTIYEIHGIKETPCCGRLQLNIGHKMPIAHISCGACDNLYHNSDGIWWFLASRFVPIDDFKEVTFKEIKEPICAQ